MTPPQKPVRLLAVGIGWIIIGLLDAQLALGLVLMPLAGGELDSFGLFLSLGGTILFTATAVIGINGAIGLLRLRPWSHTVLEVLTWVWCAICLAATGLGIYLFATWTNPTDRWVPAISMILYPFPLAIFGSMLWALRSQTLRKALVRAA